MISSNGQTLADGKTTKKTMVISRKQIQFPSHKHGASLPVELSTHFAVLRKEALFFVFQLFRVSLSGGFLAT